MDDIFYVTTNQLGKLFLINVFRNIDDYEFGLAGNSIAEEHSGTKLSQVYYKLSTKYFLLMQQCNH